MNDLKKALDHIIDRINEQNERIKELRRLEFATSVSGGLTQGSVVFAGSGGVLSQDNANLYWDDTNNRLGIGTTTPRKSLDVNGQILAADVIRAEGYNAPPSGSGLEIGYASSVAYVTGYNRTSDVYLPLVLRGSTITMQYGATIGATLDSSGRFGIGVSPTAKLDVTDGYIRARDGSNTAPTSGKGVEIVGTGNVGHVQCYNRDSSAWQQLNLSASDLIFNTNGARSFYINTSQQLIFDSGAAHISNAGSGNGIGIELGAAASGNRLALIDFHGDDTYSDYGLRIIRSNGGANTTSQIQSRGTGSLDLITVDAGYIQFYTSNTLRWIINPSGDMYPVGTGSLNLGNATVYMNDVSAKSFTDRGCIPLLTTWETVDGRKVDNLQAIREMKPHPTEKTIHGEIKLDYASVPKIAYKSVPIAEEDTETEFFDKEGKKIKFKKGEPMGEKGVDITVILGVLIGALQEIDSRIDKLEAKQK